MRDKHGRFARERWHFPRPCVCSESSLRAEKTAVHHCEGTKIPQAMSLVRIDVLGLGTTELCSKNSANNKTTPPLVDDGTSSQSPKGVECIPVPCVYCDSSTSFRLDEDEILLDDLDDHHVEKRSKDRRHRSCSSVDVLALSADDLDHYHELEENSNSAELENQIASLDRDVVGLRAPHEEGREWRRESMHRKSSSGDALLSSSHTVNCLEVTLQQPQGASNLDSRQRNRRQPPIVSLLGGRADFKRVPETSRGFLR